MRSTPRTCVELICFWRVQHGDLFCCSRDLLGSQSKAIDVTLRVFGEELRGVRLNERLGGVLLEAS